MAKDPPASLQGRALFLVGFLAAMWVLEAADVWLLGGDLDNWGVRPRTATGALGILFAPFLHGGFGHLAVNSVPFLVLGGMVLLHGRDEFGKVTTAATLVGGAGTWLVGGAGTSHIGSSVLIFGYFGYLAVRGIFQRSLLSILLSVVVIASFGWMIFGVLPSQARVSWEMHLFGALGGVLAAREVATRGAGR